MKYGDADAEIGEGREADQRLRQIERKQPAVKREADREHQRQRDEKDQPLGPPPEPQMTGAGNGPGREAQQHERCPIASLRRR